MSAEATIIDVGEDAFEPAAPVVEEAGRALAAHQRSEWGYWQEALAIGKGRRLTKDEVRSLGITTEPRTGFYRKRNKTGSDIPVAIWTDAGGMVAKIGSGMGSAEDIWTWCCDWPISEETYRAVAEQGGEWPGSDPVVQEQVAAAGHNSGRIDEAEAFADQVDAAEKGKDAYAKISDDEQLAAAQSLRSRLLELKSEGEKKHKREKEPHLEAGRAVDKKWLPVVKRAQAAADAIRSAMGAYETEKLRKQREAETARLAAEIAARKAAAKAEAPAPSRAPLPEPAAPTPIRGSYGRAASVSVVNVVTAINDQDALYRFLRDHPDLKNCMFDLAKRAVAKGHTVPGVTVEEQAKVA